MALNQKDKKGFADDLTVSSIGACLAMPNEKKKPPCIVIAYKKGTENKIYFVVADLLPKNKLHNTETLMKAIMEVEGVRNVTYTDSEGRQKDIYFCRPGSGKITDVVERDYKGNAYTGGISEIYAGKVRFAIHNAESVSFKSGKRISMDIVGANDCDYERGSYEYAAINAYNACLLGKVFEREELYLETKSKQRVKIEVRTSSSAYIEEDVLYVKPIFREEGELVDYYQTEEFHYINGEEISSRAYKITYTNRLNDYTLVRV